MKEYSELDIASLRKERTKNYNSLETVQYPIKQTNQPTLLILCSYYKRTKNKILNIIMRVHKLIED